MESGSSNTGFYVRSGGRERGPLQADELRALAASGKVRPLDELRRASDPTWRQAKFLRGLFPEVFISHAQANKDLATRIVACLEDRNIRCWVAPRNIVPGLSWAQSIVHGIEASRMLVLVFSENTNVSQHVSREVELAVKYNLPLITFKVDKAQPSRDLEYFLSSQHWLEASSLPIEEGLEQLVQAINKLLAGSDRLVDASKPSASRARAATAAAESNAASTSRANAAQAAAKKRALPLRIAAAAAVALIGIAATWWSLHRPKDPSSETEFTVQASEVPAAAEPKPVAANVESAPPSVPEPPRRSAFDVACERLSQASAWTLRTDDVPAKSFGVGITDWNPDQQSFIATVDDDGDAQPELVYSGHCVAVASTSASSTSGPASGDDSSADEATVALEPRLQNIGGTSSRVASLATSPMRFTFSPSQAALEGMWGTQKVTLVPAPAARAPSSADELRGACNAMLSEPSTWTGEWLSDGRKSERVSLFVHARAKKSSAASMVLACADDAWRRSHYAGLVVSDPIDVHMAPLLLEMSASASAQASQQQAKKGSGGLQLRLATPEQLVGTCEGQPISFQRNASAPRASDVSMAGTVWDGRWIDKQANEAQFRVSFSDSRARGAALLGVVRRASDARTLSVWDATRASDTLSADGAPPEHALWPIQLAKITRGDLRRDSSSVLLSEAAATLQLAPIDADRCVGWCGGARVELVRATMPSDVASPELATALLSEIPAWQGTIQHAGALVKLFVRVASASGGHTLTFTTPTGGNQTLAYVATLASDPLLRATWPLACAQAAQQSTLLVGCRALESGSTQLSLRADRDRKLRGWCGDDWIELARDDDYDEFWRTAVAADALVANDQADDAVDVYKKARKALSPKHWLMLVADERIAYASYTRCRSDAKRKSAPRNDPALHSRACLFDAIELFGPIARSASVVRDQDGVSVAARAAYRCAQHSGHLMAYYEDEKDANNYKDMKIKYERWLQILSTTYSGEGDEHGRPFVDLVKAEVRKYEQENR